MADENPTSAPRYRWPKFLLGALALGVIVAILWVTYAALRIHSERESGSPFAPATNTPVR